MLTLEQLHRQVQSAEDLQSITRAMKALSAVRIRQSRRAVESLAEYSRTVELSLRAALRRRPREVRLRGEDHGSRMGVVVFGSDMGLAGRFNIRIAEFALARLEEADPPVGERTVLAVGARVAAQLESAGQSVSRHFDAPDSIDAVGGTVQELLLAIEETRTLGGVERFRLYYNHYLTGATYRPDEVNLLPLDLAWLDKMEETAWPTNVSPRFRIGWEELFRACVREHLFVSLFAAAARSQAAENASRLASMEAAERRIEERLGELRGRLNQQRQQVITEELLDLVTGFLSSEAEEATRESGGGPEG